MSDIWYVSMFVCLLTWFPYYWYLRVSVVFGVHICGYWFIIDLIFLVLQECV
jgi:hypothetical protein